MGPALQAASDQPEAAEPSSFPAPHLNGINHHSKSEHRSSGQLRRLKGHATDLSRLSAVRSGDAAQGARFIKEISGTVWSACRLLAGGDADARHVFSEVMAALTANRFARLGAYAGRGNLDTFVALTVRDLLAERMLRLLQSDQKQAWHAFEHLFGADIARLIRKRLPDSSEDARRDAYQDICLALIDDGYRRLRTYGGSGSFAGFVLRTVDRLLIDIVRSVARRRRVPAHVAKLSALDQEIFKLICWRGAPERPDVLADLLKGLIGRLPEAAEISATLARLRASGPLESSAFPKCVSADHLDDVASEGELSPEDHLIHADEDRRLAAAVEALTDAMNTLPAAERLYLTIALSGSRMPPAREIARLMQRPVEDIYKLKQRVLLRLREIASADSKIKTWRASV